MGDKGIPYNKLIPYLFILAMDELTRHNQKELQQCMSFVNNIVFADENSLGLK